MEIRPLLHVLISPGEVQKGQMLAIQSWLTEKKTHVPVTVEKLYMEILNEKGVAIWPKSTIAENTSRFDKLISTSQMAPGKYLVRVSPNRNLSPMGVAEFSIKKTLPVVAIPLIPAGIRAVSTLKKNLVPAVLPGPAETGRPEVIKAKPRSTIEEKIEADYIEPYAPKITWVMYRTERDARVCPICINYDGLVFRIDDPEIIRIGPPEKDGDTHWGCRCNYDFISQDMEQELARDSFNAAVEEATEIAEIAEVAMIAMKVIKH